MRTTKDGSYIIVGGDCGFARLFERSSGVLLQTLKHDKGGRESTVAVLLSCSPGVVYRGYKGADCGGAVSVSITHFL